MFTQFAVDRASDAAIWMLADGQIIYVNDAACKSLGYANDELLVMQVFDINPSFDREGWREHWQRLKTKRTLVFETEEKAKDGRLFPVEVTANYLEYDGEEYNIAFARNITERKRVEERLKNRTAELEAANEQLSALYAVSSTISQSLDLDTVLTAVIKEIAGMFGFDGVGVYLPDTSNETLILRASTETEREYFTRINAFRRGEGINGRVAETCEPLVFANLESDPRYTVLSATGAARRLAKRFLGVFPVMGHSGAIGTLVCIGERRRNLSDGESQLISSMVNQIGSAVENASLFEETHRRAQELAALVKINRDVATVLDRDTLLPRIIEEAKSLLHMDGGNFRLLEGDALVLHSSVHDQALRFRARLRSDESLSGRIVAENRVIALRDIQTEPSVIDRHHDMMEEAEQHSFLGAPLRVGDRVIGTINLLSRERRDFSDEEIDLMGAFAAQAAIAIENANLFKGIRDNAAALEQLNQELQEASRVKADFMNAMSHELRTPLSVTIGYIGLLLDGFGGTLSKVQVETLENVQHQSRLLFKLIGDVLTLGRLEAGKVGLQVNEAPLAEVLKHVRAFAEQLNREKQLDLVWAVPAELPRIMTDHVKLEEILQNLIGNAYKFTRTGCVEVGVRNLPREARVEFRVIDTGVGIEAKDLDKVFEAFHQSCDAHTGGLDGVGLGLSIVRQYLELLHGDFQVQSKVGVGSNFTFTLPYRIEPPQAETVIKPRDSGNEEADQS